MLLGGTDLRHFSSVTQLCPTLCDPMNCSTPGFPVFPYLPEFAQTHVQQAGDAIQPSHPLSAPSPPALNLSQHQGVFHWVSSLHQVAKVSASIKISPSNEHPGLISFQMDWLDLLGVQGTLKSLLQHHSSKASIHCPISCTEWIKDSDGYKDYWRSICTGYLAICFKKQNIAIALLSNL